MKDKAESYHPNPQIRRMKEQAMEPEGDEGAQPKSYSVHHHADGTAHSHIHHADDTHEHTDHENAEEAHMHVGKGGGNPMDEGWSEPDDQGEQE